MVTCGSLNDFIFNKVSNDDELIKRDYIEFTELIYVEANRKNYPDIDT